MTTTNRTQKSRSRRQKELAFLKSHGQIEYSMTAQTAIINPQRNLNIRANTNPQAVGSVLFGLDGNANYRLENSAPYALAGETNNSGTVDYLPWTPTVGSHTLTRRLSAAATEAEREARR